MIATDVIADHSGGDPEDCEYPGGEDPIPPGC
jgi:hypothetical protein